jgi:hypothetical protein
MSKNVINSLPNRPLKPHEEAVLVDSGKFVPMTLKQRLPEDTTIPFHEMDDLDNALDKYGVVHVYSFLHATEEYALTIAFSEKEQRWMQAAKQYNHEYNYAEIEAQTYEFIENHDSFEIDEGEDLDLNPKHIDPQDC